MSEFRKLPSEQETKEALFWLTEILYEEKVPYQVVGGLAAKAYGATKPLVDIDLHVPNRHLDSLARRMQTNIEHPPVAHLSEKWDLTYMSAFFGIQKVEIGGGDNTRIYNAHESQWEKQNIDYGSSETMNVFGFRLPIIPKKQLVSYKKTLARDVDLQDIYEITRTD